MVQVLNDQSERVRTIGRNTAYNTLRSVIAAGVAFSTGIVVARGLGPTDTGVYALVIWVAHATTVIVSDGLGLTLTKQVAQHGLQTESARLGGLVAFAMKIQFVLAVLGGAALVVLSGSLANLFGTPEAQALFVIAGALVFSQAFMDMFSAPINGLERQGLLVPLKTAWVISQLIAATIVLLVLDAGLWSLIIAQVVVNVPITFLHFAVLRRLVPLRSRAPISRALGRNIVRTAAILTISSTLGLVVFTRSAVFILGYFAESADVAFYSIAYAMADALQLILPMALAFAIMPTISRALGEGDFQLTRRAYEGQLRLTVLVTAPIAIGGAVLSSSVIRTFYGSAFEEAAIPLSVLLFTAALRTLALTATWVLVGSDRERLVVATYAVCATVNLGLGFALIPSLGVTGAVIAEAATQLVFMTLSMTLVWRTLGFGIPAGGLLRIVLANAPVLMAVALVVRVVEGSLARVVLGMLVVLPAYVLGLRVTNALSPFEKQYLRERLALARGT